MKNLMKKISVFALLLSLMLSFVIPVSASAATETIADDVKYKDVEDYMQSMGYIFEKKENCYYVVVYDNFFSNLHVLELFYPYSEDGIFLACDTTYNNLWFFTDESYSVDDCLEYTFHNPQDASTNNKFDYTNCETASYRDSWYYNGVKKVMSNISMGNSVDNDILYSDFDVYEIDRTMAGSNVKFNKNTERLYFTSNRLGEYSFSLWCSDAGLNCKSSSNESDMVIPYSYNSYWHIVRKISNGKWLLTTIGNSVLQENISDYRLLVGVNGNLHVASIYSGDDVNGYKINVRQYEYDTDGWKLRTYETLDTRDSSGIVDLGAGSGFDDTRILAYTSESIYDHNGSVPLYEKSTEYFDVTNTPDIPNEPDSPTSTPSNPSGGSGSEGGGTGGGTRPESPDIGGDAESGGGLDFIISLFTKIWTDICSVNMSVDGYSINLQQIVIYGALVSIVGGFIMHFIFGRR